MTTSLLPFEAVDQAVEQVKPIIERLAKELWQLSELSLQEVKSVQLVMDVLQEHGFTITSKGTAGIPTAFIGEYGSGTPILGILAEYDALPGLGNEPVPHQEPRKDHVTSGHACGHNLLGAGAIGAALALKNLMAEQKIPGTLRLYGCAAEETEGAKVYMAREGLFNDLDRFSVPFRCADLSLLIEQYVRELTPHFPITHGDVSYVHTLHPRKVRQGAYLPLT